MTTTPDDDDDDFDGQFSMEGGEPDPAHPFWRNWERPPCPKCDCRPARFLVYGHPSEDWEPPDSPYQHGGCMPAPDGAIFECTECGHRWNPERKDQTDEPIEPEPFSEFRASWLFHIDLSRLSPERLDEYALEWSTRAIAADLIRKKLISFLVEQGDEVCNRVLAALRGQSGPSEEDSNSTIEQFLTEMKLQKRFEN